ncbi:MAG: hypothetical protein R3174_07950 [Gammaproteobacteria bacterium]|nr:hypothetical protein [Gammaproteobacteria bacterium]
MISIAWLVLTGCTQLSEIPRTQSAIEQQLLVRAIERSLEKVDTTALDGKTVFLEVSVNSSHDVMDAAFLENRIRAWLRERGVRLTEVAEGADAEVQVFAPVLGTDRGESLVGIPSVPIPLINIPTPEIALFKQVKNRGRSEVQLYEFEPKTGEFIRKTPVSVGESKYDNHLVLFFFKYTVSDIELTRDSAEASPSGD